MPPETATTLSHCPTCGMKITRQGLSICSYCSAPLTLGGAAKEGTAGDSATTTRLAKMHDHDAFAAAQAWVPPEEPTTQRAATRRRWGAFILGLGSVGLVAAGAMVGIGTGLLRSPLAIASVLLLAVGVRLVLRTSKLIRAARVLPILRRCAIVTDRRSETEAQGGFGSTTYYFMLEFEDGTAGEFRFPGRGAHHDPLTPGNTGMAYTRKDVLLDFKLIRV